MAWTTDTYAGEWAYGVNGVLKTGLHELCLAVNERQGCIGLTKTQFQKADGTPGTDLALSDFTNMFTTGSTLIPFSQNCRSVMAGIKAMRQYFAPTSGIATPYTLAGLEAAVGLGTFLDEPRKANDPLFFQQCHDALNLLIHAVRSGSFVTLSGTTMDRRQQTIPADTDREAVWDSAAGATPTHPAAVAQMIYEYSMGVDDEYTNCNIYSNFESLSLNLTPYTGALTAAQYSGVTSSPSSTHGGSMTAYIGSTPFTATVTAGGSVSQTLAADETELTLGTVSDVVLDCDIPATCPLEALSVPSNYARVQFVPVGWAVYFDIAAELTDQA